MKLHLPAAPAVVLAHALAFVTVLAATPAAYAQAAPAQPAVRPAPAAAAAKPEATRAFGSGTGPILTREELRSCLSQEEQIRKRLSEHEAVRPGLDAEKDKIGTEQNALREERASVEGMDKAVSEIAARGRAFSERVERWNARVKAFNESNPTGLPGAHEREQINAERTELEKERKAIEDERLRVQAQRVEAVRVFNLKVGTVDARVAEWNKRNSAWNEAGTTLESDRLGWVAGCANRRYREDDEVYLRRSK